MTAGESRMSGASQNIVFASLGIVGLMALAAIADLATGAPFGGQTVPDVLFLVAAAMTGLHGIRLPQKEVICHPAVFLVAS